MGFPLHFPVNHALPYTKPIHSRIPCAIPQHMMILILMATLRSVSLVSEFWGWPRSKASEFGSPGTALHPPAALCRARAQAHRAEGSLGKALRRSQLAQEKDHGCEEGGAWAANFWGYRIGIIFFEWGIPVRRPALPWQMSFHHHLYGGMEGSKTRVFRNLAKSRSWEAE